jgi:AraC-like DNA-binding protein
VFSCWSQDGIVAWDFERDRVFASITLKAYYVETIGFVVSFDEEMQAHEANTLLEKPADPQRASTAEYQYTFAGWYYLKDGELVAWDFEKEARKLAVSYPHFRRLFEQFFQVPPGKFLLSARLEKAAALLTGSDLQIREVAQECGFEDEFYFSRIFKKYRRLPPKKYRSNFR